MRISGGGARGIPVIVPKGDMVRPATDGLRQALFSSLAGRIGGATFLDLFAGSGAYGLEALSRGASGGVFVERNPKAVAALRHNLAAVCKSLGRGLEGLEIRQGDVLGASLEVIDARGLATFPDLVFVDPPYELIAEVAPRVFARLGELGDARGAMLVAFEMPGETTLNPSGWTCVKRLGKGARQPTVGIFRRG